MIPNTSVHYSESANLAFAETNAILSSSAASPLAPALRSVRAPASSPLREVSVFFPDGILEKSAVSLKSEGIREGGEEGAVPAGDCRGGSAKEARKRRRRRKELRDLRRARTDSEESCTARSPIRRPQRRMNPNNGDEASNDITGFGQGLPSAQQYPFVQGGRNPGLQTSAQPYPFLPGGWTAALNQALNHAFMPLQQPASSPAPHAQNEPVAATVESVEAATVESVDSAAVMKESQGDGEGVSAKAGRRCKGVPGRSKLSNFSPKEDVFLVKSWLEISCDAIVNTGQKKEGFWARIKGQYDNKRGTFHERSARSLQSRWETIKVESSKFSGYMVNVLRDNPSGMSDADKTTLALSNFAAIEQYTYIYMHCWDLLKDEPKWMELKGTRPGDNDAIADHIPAGTTDINRDLETPPSQYAGSKRPMGRDAAKKAAKKSASSSPSESSQYASKLQDLSIQKISIWEEENAKKGSRYEQRVAIESQRYNEMRLMESQRYEEACQHNKKMASIEEEKLQIMRKKADREQTHEEERILGIDLDKCTPHLRKYYEKKQQKILQDIGVNEDDN